MPEETGQGESTAETAVNDAQGQPGTSTARESLADSLTSVGKVPEGISEHAANLLKGLDPLDIQKFAPKVSEWDSGVQKLLRERDERYAPFQGMDATAAREALEMQQAIFSDPVKAMELLKARFGEQLQQPVVEEPTAEETDFSYDDLPDFLKAKLDLIPKLEAVVETLAKKEINLQQQEIARAQMSNYNQLLDDLTEKHGAFDRDWVTLALAGSTSITPDEAVEKWHNSVKSAAEELLKEHNNAPNVLGGKSTVPMEAVDVTKLSDKDTKGLITKMLLDARAANS